MKTTDADKDKADRVIKAVCDAHGITRAELKTNIAPRQIATYLLKIACGLRLRTIRETLGLVVDSQVYQHCARVKKMMSDNPHVKELVEKVTADVRGEAETVQADVSRAGIPANAAEEGDTVPARRRGQTRKPKREVKKKSPNKVLASIAATYCTPSLLTQHDPGSTIAEARQIMAYLLWRECELPIAEIANTMSASSDEVFMSLGQAIVLLDSDIAFGKVISDVCSRL